MDLSGKTAVVCGSTQGIGWAAASHLAGLGARIMLTDAATEAMRKPLNPVVAAFKAFEAAKLINMPMWKVIPGLLTQWKQMYQLSLFGAATVKLMKATVDGDTKEGIQFIGQSQGLINDVATVEAIIQRCVTDAIDIHNGRMATMIAEERKIQYSRGDVVLLVLLRNLT